MYANELWPIDLQVRNSSAYGTENHPFRGVFDKKSVLKSDQGRDPCHMNVRRIQDHQVSLAKN
jgi:hypothetical protein